MKKQRRRTKAKHGKGRQINWQLVALALVAAVGLTKLWETASRWQAQQAAFQEQSALQEPDELFRPDVGDPPYTIAVDAGHGGDDPGATGVVVERDMTAATAEALTRWLDADPNYIPAATRDSYDVTATPSERAERSNTQNPDLLLSIHGNSASTEAAGFECYPITPGRTWHRESVLAQGKRLFRPSAGGWDGGGRRFPAGTAWGPLHLL